MEPAAKHLTMAELEAGLREIRRSPRDRGVLELIVRGRASGNGRSSSRAAGTW